MPKFDITITISVIVALCAIVSPIFTAIINNHYQLKLKKIELEQREYEDHVLYERQIYETYLANAGRCINCQNLETEREYGASYLVALMHAPPEWREIMIKADRQIATMEREAANDTLETLTPLIRAKLQMQ